MSKVTIELKPKARTGLVELTFLNVPMSGIEVTNDRTGEMHVSDDNGICLFRDYNKNDTLVTLLNDFFHSTQSKKKKWYNKWYGFGSGHGNVRG